MKQLKQQKAAKQLGSEAAKSKNVNNHSTVQLFNHSTAKHFAFTLAEVLITLAIIGIVAALTIPTLISKYNTMVLNTQFKKIYATLSQALTYAQSEFGHVPLCYYGDGISSQGSECEELTNTMLKILKISKTCENNALANGCIPEYKGIDDLLKEQHKNDADYVEKDWQDYANYNCGGWNTNEIKRKRAFVLSDGTIIFEYLTRSGWYFRHIAIDVNGKKGPNKWGHDLHAFNLQSNGNYFKYKGSPAGCIIPQDGGVYTETKMKELFGHK